MPIASIFSPLPRTTLVLNRKRAKRLKSVLHTNLVLGYYLDKIMKKIIFFVAIALLFVLSVATFAGCGLLGALNGTAGDAKSYDKEFAPATGKWVFLDENKEPTNTYFEFDGANGKMSFAYVEDGAQKFAGTYRVVQPSETGKERTYVFSWCLDKKDGEKEDVLYCYSDDFTTAADGDFKQFTIMQAEKKLSMVDGNTYFHNYRISELPYKMGTYVKEGKAFAQEKDEYKYADTYMIPSGTYVLDENVSITFFATKPRPYYLFSYKNGDKVVEGVYLIGQNKDAIYFYIQHDPYQKVTKEDKKIYDTTFSIYYPADFNVHGQFDVNANNPQIVINEFVATSHAPEYEQGFLRTGTYTFAINQNGQQSQQ